VINVGIAEQNLMSVAGGLALAVHGEEVLGAALRGRNGQAVIATKFSPKNSSADSVVQACEGSLTRLGRECIDIYQSH
jgi:aryl-alcohol dehydrogenase-like predicted oxidoreductase